ncbi:hypothetical protein ACP70R_007660 [Stipagrostis hirtigluma subsp. patula]
MPVMQSEQQAREAEQRVREQLLVHAESVCCLGSYFATDAALPSTTTFSHFASSSLCGVK